MVAVVCVIAIGFVAAVIAVEKAKNCWPED